MENTYMIDGLTIVHEYFKDEINELGEITKIKVIVCKENTDHKLKMKGYTYTDSKKEGNKRYVNNNREKVNKYISEYVKNRCENDQEYQERLREQKRLYYHRKKEKKMINNNEN